MFMGTLGIGEWSVHAWVHEVYQSIDDKTDGNNNIPSVAYHPHLRDKLIMWENSEKTSKGVVILYIVLLNMNEPCFM